MKMSDNVKAKRARKARGFTLVELLIVIIIIGILAGGMLLVAGSGTDKANATKIVSDLRSLKSAALMYYADNNAWPAEGDVKDVLGKYMDRELVAGDYEYKVVSFDMVGYKGDLVTNEEGVREKLTSMATETGLYNINGTPYNDNNDGVYMRVR
ncbi:prepilin-type N-terminal cleavage/methylation domain-containing protein [Dethiosulfovibrio sp. F2B]|uniref:type II secretion system protein n=1 Tax=Dethiosulfovibrio faecalis TaxID=2720018 RepID=UPI001F25DF56|nr:prepilin-type N-terminal cleavage/methylation domain-containing protein [Dethiosulfovibrio faecalis]MCF4150383.1 prepilin-type N-terminal cleavage/methylation domain-containing protein [Dethiosulfovibrio faecalis]